MHERERRAVDQSALLIARNMLRKASRIGFGAGDRDRIVEMQRARAAIIVKAVRHVRILLEFEQRKAASDRMDGARRNKQDIARRNRPPVDQLLDRAVERSGAQFVPRCLASEAQADSRAGLGVEYIPAFAL